MAPEAVFTEEPERVAAERLLAAWLSADAARGSTRLAIAGGSALAAFQRARWAVPDAVWARTRLTWVDERVVPLSSPDSNRGAAHRSGVFAVPPAIELGLVADGESVASALLRVDAVLRADFGGMLDLTLLGMGPDGHIASLFPGLPWGSAALVMGVEASPKPPSMRVTLTRTLLATARAHVLVAIGASKQQAVNRLIQRDPSLPATGLDGLVIVTDVKRGDT